MGKGGTAQTFGAVVLLFGALAALPPAPLKDFQPVALLQLEDSQTDLISVRRGCRDNGRQKKIVSRRPDNQDVAGVSFTF